MNRLLRLRGYPPALAGLLAAASLHYLGMQIFGPRVPGFLLLYVISLLWASWCGFGPGILNCLLMLTAVPYVFTPNYKISQFNLRTFVIMVVVSLLVSAASANRARAEDTLRRTNSELDERVRQRTQELERANTELGHRLAELENLYRKLAVGVAFLDRDLRFGRLNEEMASINGASVADHLGRPFRDMVAPDLAASIEPLLRQALSSGDAIVDYPLQSRTPETAAEFRDWFLSCSPVRAEDGAILGLQVLVQDVTERNRFNERLRHTAKLESLGVLAGGIAHDFNNLLTGILGNASLAQEMLPRGHNAGRLLKDVVHASERAAELTRQLLAYAGKGRFRIEPMSLPALIRELQPLIATSIGNRAEIGLDLKGGSCVAGDPSQMQQVIMNLVINGAEAIEDGQTGGVTVSTSDVRVGGADKVDLVGGQQLPPGDYVCLEVRDTGAGMDAATLERIFDPFFTTKFTGRGLGLAAVLGIVRGHHGGLSVVSTPGHGTCFHVFLPAVVAEQRAPASVRPALPDHAGRAVLVVDDEEMVRRTARAALESYGYKVVLAASGPEAISIVRQKADISLIVLDLTMPVMDGEQTYRELRRIDPAIKVILSSGYDETDATRRFAGQALAGFVQKPYSVTTLITSVNAALPRVVAAPGAWSA